MLRFCLSLRPEPVPLIAAGSDTVRGLSCLLASAQWQPARPQHLFTRSSSPWCFTLIFRRKHKRSSTVLLDRNDFHNLAIAHISHILMPSWKKYPDGSRLLRQVLIYSILAVWDSWCCTSALPHVTTEDDVYEDYSIPANSTVIPNTW